MFHIFEFGHLNIQIDVTSVDNFHWTLERNTLFLGILFVKDSNH